MKILLTDGFYIRQFPQLPELLGVLFEVPEQLCLYKQVCEDVIIAGGIFPTEANYYALVSLIKDAEVYFLLTSDNGRNYNQSNKFFWDNLHSQAAKVTYIIPEDADCSVLDTLNGCEYLVIEQVSIPISQTHVYQKAEVPLNVPIFIKYRKARSSRVKKTTHELLGICLGPGKFAPLSRQSYLTIPEEDIVGWAYCVSPSLGFYVY